MEPKIVIFRGKVTLTFTQDFNGKTLAFVLILLTKSPSSTLSSSPSCHQNKFYSWTNQSWSFVSPGYRGQKGERGQLGLGLPGEQGSTGAPGKPTETEYIEVNTKAGCVLRWGLLPARKVPGSIPLVHRATPVSSEHPSMHTADLRETFKKSEFTETCLMTA